MEKNRIYRILSVILCLLLLVGSFSWIGDAGYAYAAETVEVAAQAASDFKVHFIDVGQADAALIECDGKTMLIDGGNAADSNLIYSYLSSRKITHLDYVIGTHAHEDHIGGLPGALQYATVGTVYCATTSFTTTAFKNFVKAVTNRGKSIIVPTVGLSFNLGSAVCTVLAVNTESSDLNNTSIVLRIVYGETSFLFTGDAEQPVEKKMIEQGRALKSTVLKVGHHGSGSSTSYEFLWNVMPQYAVISCAKDNSYGHPHDEPLSRLRDADVQLYRTDLQGDVICTSNGKTVSFTVSRNANADVYAEVGGSNPKPSEPEPTVPESTAPTVVSPDYATAVQIGQPYALCMNTAGTNRYFNGGVDGTYRLSSSTEETDAVYVYLEAVSGVSGAYRLYYNNENGIKTYIRIYEYQDGTANQGKANIGLTTQTPEEYYTFNTVADTLFYTADADNSYYMGTYDSYTTFAASNIRYITGSNASKVDVSQYPARLYPVLQTVNFVESWGISLEDDLKVSFCLDLGYQDQVKITVGDQEQILTTSQMEITEEGSYIATVPVAAAQMTDTITVQLHNSTKPSAIWTGTVRQYADTLLTDTSYRQYHAILREMLNYGGCAQSYFGYHTDRLANAGITDAGKTAVPAQAETELSVTDRAAGGDFYGAGLVYRDKIAVRFYFQITDSIGYCTFLANGREAVPVLKDGLYYIEVADIMPDQLAAAVTVSMTDAQGNPVTVSYSPVNYMVRMNQKGSNSLKSLMQALYNYYIVAEDLRTMA